ncbi:MAG: hypothetical protein DRP11_00515 [Candidatus Aenigmatarchaeota archaeon]|nr:MAG: hypothetical protein DRP11_00515 [Candidatus Aenigmarchaeota archaeon]
MGEWKCGKCGKVYTTAELVKLKRVPLVPEDTDPWKQHGFTCVCECGYVFHRDRWHIKTPFEIKSEIGVLKGVVSTVFLELNYGTPEEPLWYETMVFVDEPRDVECWLCLRYRTKDEAEKGHRRVVEALKKGRFKVVPEEWVLLVDVEGEEHEEGC